MLPLEDSLNIVDDVVSTLNFKLFAEEIPTINSLYRVLSNPQFSRINLPPFNKATKDGIAILNSDRLDDKREYKIIETVAAGTIAKQKLLPGTTIKIMTGAPIPINTSIVVPIEMIKIDNGIAKIIEWPKNDSNICHLGNDMTKGKLLLSTGKILDPISIASLISCGITQVPVFFKIKAAIISTGKEIVNNFENMSNSKIMNSNEPMLKLLCKKVGIDPIITLTVNDDYNVIVKTIVNFLTITDLILITGGVSKGDFDFVTNALSAAGLTIHFNSIAIKPGKPTVFASSETKIVFALPGNPLSAYISFRLFVLHAIKKIYNIKNKHEKYISLPMAQEFKRVEHIRTEYVPCKINTDGTLTPLNYNNSANLAILLKADGFFVVPKGMKVVRQKSNVDFLKLS